MIVTRQRKQKKSSLPILLPNATNGSLKPVATVFDGVWGVISRPLSFAYQQQQITDRNQDIKTLNDKLEADRKAAADKDAQRQIATAMGEALAGLTGATGDVANSEVVNDAGGFPAPPFTSFTAPNSVGKRLSTSVTLDFDGLSLTKKDIKPAVEAAPSGSVFEPDKLLTEPIDLYVNNILIARGEVVVVDDKFAVKISELNPVVDRI